MLGLERGVGEVRAPSSIKRRASRKEGALLTTVTEAVKERRLGAESRAKGEGEWCEGRGVSKTDEG